MMHKAWSRIEKVPYCFSRSYVKCQGHTAGLDAYFFPSLTVGQPSNNMDLSEIEIYMGMMMILFLAMKEVTHREEFWSSICLVFSCDQAALWMVFSVCLSVRLSVCLSVTPFWLCSHLRIIMKFSGVITNDKSDVHAKGQGQRSKVKVTEVNTQLNRFRTVTPVWIHIWWWNDAYSLMMLRRGALLFLKVIRQISRSHGSKKRQIWPRLGVSGL